MSGGRCQKTKCLILRKTFRFLSIKFVSTFTKSQFDFSLSARVLYHILSLISCQVKITNHSSSQWPSQSVQHVMTSILRPSIQIREKETNYSTTNYNMTFVYSTNCLVYAVCLTPLTFHTDWCLWKDKYSHSMFTPSLRKNVFALSGKMSGKGMKALWAPGEKSWKQLKFWVDPAGIMTSNQWVTRANL